MTTTNAVTTAPSRPVHDGPAMQAATAEVRRRPGRMSSDH